MIEFENVNPNLIKLSDYIKEKTRFFFKDNGKFNIKYFENVKCYFCKNTVFISEFYDKYGFRHIRCKVCSMVYVNPRLKEKIVHNLYSKDDYNQYYKIKLLPALGYRRNVLGVNKYKQIVRILNINKGRVLDIGCGLGEVLSIFKENGWQVKGIEYNPFAANYSKEHFGISVFEGSIYNFKEMKKFDVIMLWGVLEHLYNPWKILQRCKTLLAKDGLLVIEVPSADSFLVRYVEKTNKGVDRIIEGDRHLMLFSVNSLIGLLEKSGFICKKLLSNGLDVATIDRLFMKKTLTNNSTDALQRMLDESLQGDLLRGFFTERV